MVSSSGVRALHQVWRNLWGAEGTYRAGHDAEATAFSLQGCRAALLHGRRCNIGCRTQCVACMLACCASLLWMQSCQRTGACHFQPGCLSRFRCAFLWHGMLESTANSHVKDGELAFHMRLSTSALQSIQSTICRLSWTVPMRMRFDTDLSWKVQILGYACIAPSADL